MYYRRRVTRKTALLLAVGIWLAGSAPRARADATDCQTAIVSAASKFEQAKLKALQKCEAGKRKGKISGDCRDDVKTAEKIAGALAKMQAAVTGACAGVTLTQIGWDGSGSGGNPVLAKACNGGERQNDLCTRETECPGQCIGGTKDTEGCSFNSTCQNRICEHAKCVGGSMNGADCSSTTLKASCISGGGSCPFHEQCDGGSSGALGVCVGGGNPGATCGAPSDCTGGGVCDAGCNTGNLLDCVSGICEGALCSANKDCGLCTGGPNIYQSCAADSDCGKLCINGGNGGKPCKTAGDCPGGSCSTVASSCSTGVCGAGGFCTSGGAHYRAAAFCAAVDSCPGIESHNVPGVYTCDSGVNKGLPCDADADCDTGSCKQGCNFGLSNATDVANCVACIGESAVDQLNALIGDDIKPVVADSAVAKCRAAIGKNTAKYFASKRKIVAKCEAGVLAGKITGPCSADQATLDGIAAAATKMSAGIAKACGGSDKVFGAAADTLPDDISKMFTCPNLGAQGTAAACAGATGTSKITTVQELNDCLTCVANFAIDCVNAASLPANGALPSGCNPNCGNNKIDGHCSTATTTQCGSSIDCPSGQTCIPTETCDDGNTENGDACPSDCIVTTCTPSGTFTATVNLTTPAGVDVAGLTAYVEYPDGTVSLPGSLGGTLQSRVTKTYSGFKQANDLDYAVRVVVSADTPPMASDAFHVTFDGCSGAGAPTAGQFRCSVESASNDAGEALSGVSCSVSLP